MSKKIFYYIVAFKQNCKKSGGFHQYAFTTYDEAMKFLVQLHVCSNVTDIHFYEFPQDCLEELEINYKVREVE